MCACAARVTVICLFVCLFVCLFNTALRNMLNARKLKVWCQQVANGVFFRYDSRIFVNVHVFVSKVMLIFAYHDGVVALLGEVFT